MNIIRWLACPVAYILAHWCLLAYPEFVTTRYPALWKTGGKGVDEVLPPHPKTQLQAFELGHTLGIYEKIGCNTTASRQPRECADLLQRAADVVKVSEPLTAAQMARMRQLLVELDAQKSIVDRVAGFFSFVNVIWMISIIGVLATIGPCIAYLVGPFLLRCMESLYRHVLRPVAIFLHSWGVFEVAAYTLAFAFSAQGCRYSMAQAQPAMMVALTGGLAFMPCWMYSTGLHVTGSGSKDKFFMLSCGLLVLELVPLALIHKSSLIGFLAVLALYGCLGFVFAAFGFGFLIGFDSRNAVLRCVLASVCLVLGFTSCRILGLDPAYIQPFALGAMCLGNNMYFLAMLILTSEWRCTTREYVWRQSAMIASLLLALFVGFVYVIPAMSNTATTFMVLWLMEKELEIRWGGFGIVIIFLNFVALYFAALYLHTHPEHIVAMFDAKGLFLAAA
mmetsp:Transcript_41468/g.72829  ORF Transcript_41468/g.72829 Transcript_41468/m.72829 type:complete len:449 (-) Transcript_41468:92-1438(-)